MKSSHNIEAIIDRQIERWQMENRLQREKKQSVPTLRPIVTISRTYGSGGAEVGRLVAERLNCQYYDSSLINQIAERGEVRRELVEALDEGSRTSIQQWISDLLHGRIFDESDYQHHLFEILQSLAQMQSVVIVGRGANYILGNCPRLDIRVDAPLELRIGRIAVRKSISRDEARREVQRNDLERARFIKRIFGKEWDNPLDYDLVVNTGRWEYACAAAFVEHAWMQRATLCPGPALRTRGD